MNIVVRTLSDQLFDLVRRRILAGDISTDAAIRQDVLAAELGVSKIPLREALARLEQDGLVTSQPNRGFFVRPMTASEAEEIFALRLQIEPDAVAFGALNATDADRLAARDALRALGGRARPEDLAMGERNRAFHLALVQPGGRTLTCNLIERLHVLAERYVRKHLEPAGRNARAEAEHREILDAWNTGQADQARELTHAHISATLQDLRRELADEVAAQS